MLSATKTCEPRSILQEHCGSDSSHNGCVKLAVSVKLMSVHADLGLDLRVFFTLCLDGYKTSIYLFLYQLLKDGFNGFKSERTVEQY